MLPPGPLRLLDLGCGTGGLLAALERQQEYRPAVGLDCSPLALGLARAKTGAALVRGDATRLPFRDASFDLIVSVDALYTRQAYPGLARTLQTVWRLLRPGGLVLLQLPAFGWLRSAHDDNVHGAHRFTRAELEAALREAGFPAPRVYYRLAALLPVAWLLRKLGGTRPGESHVRVPHPAANWLLYRGFAMEERLARAGWLPFGLSVFAVAGKPAGEGTP